MKILLIDSHKGTENEIPQNLHWQNAKILSDALGAKLIWSYPSVNDRIEKGFDAIIFNHASQYNFVDYEWVKSSPDAEIFFISNEYNLGEQPTLWKACKGAGRHYTVIANHEPKISKITKKYVKDWRIVNLNALSYKPVRSEAAPDLFARDREGCIYYGSYRKGRESSFKKYLTGKVLVSTHIKNVPKFERLGIRGPFRPRVSWSPKGLGLRYLQSSLYIEDDITHKSYNFLANRFYEALNYDCVPIFTEECRNTIEKSGYPISDTHIIRHPDEISQRADLHVPASWHHHAMAEKKTAIDQIRAIINLPLDRPEKCAIGKA